MLAKKILIAWIYEKCKLLNICNYFFKRSQFFFGYYNLLLSLKTLASTIILFHSSIEVIIKIGVINVQVLNLVNRVSPISPISRCCSFVNQP